MIKLIEEFWETYLQARLYYSLDTPDLIIALDEMKVPLEVHSKWICVVGKIRHPWIMSHGFSKVHFTVVFAFTLAGRKLAPIFIFPAKRGKRLSAQIAT